MSILFEDPSDEERQTGDTIIRLRRDLGECRAAREAAEAELAEAAAHECDLIAEKANYMSALTDERRAYGDMKIRLEERIEALEARLALVENALRQVNLRKDEDGYWLVVGNFGRNLSDLGETSIRFRNLLDWKELRDAALDEVKEGK